MIKIACHDVSDLNCPFEAADETDDGVRQQMIDHFLAEHGEQMDKMDEKEKDRMSEKLEELITAGPIL